MWNGIRLECRRQFSYKLEISGLRSSFLVTFTVWLLIVNTNIGSLVEIYSLGKAFGS